MPKPFDFHGWRRGVDARIGKIEEYLQKLSAYQKGGGQIPPGLGQRPDERELTVLRAGFRTLERDMDNAKKGISRFDEVHRDLEDNDRELEAAVRSVEARVSELSYHVGVYDETVQGIAIRPERAVPSTVLDPKTGAAYVNPVKVVTRPFWLASTPRQVVVPANGQVQMVFTIPPEANLEGDMEIYFLELAACTSTSLRVRLQDTGRESIYLMNAPVHILSVFGDMRGTGGAWPFSLYQTIFLEPGMQLIVELTDFSGAPNTVELIAHGRKFMGYSANGMDRRGLINVFARNSWPFWLTTDVPLLLTAGAGVQTQFTMTLNRQYHAELAKAMRYGTVGGVPAPVPYHFTLNEGASGNLIIDNVPVDSVAGDGNFPFGLPEPMLALRGTLLAGNATNDTGLANQTSDLVLHGRALPISFPGQQVLEPLLRGRSIQLPPGQNKMPGVPRMVSM